MRMIKWIGVLLLLCHFSAEAQIHRYVVFFADKADSKYSIDQPEAFLSQHLVNLIDQKLGFEKESF